MCLLNFSLLHIHWSGLMKQRKTWTYSLALLHPLTVQIASQQVGSQPACSFTFSQQIWIPFNLMSWYKERETHFWIQKKHSVAVFTQYSPSSTIPAVQQPPYVSLIEESLFSSLHDLFLLVAKSLSVMGQCLWMQMLTNGNGHLANCTCLTVITKPVEINGTIQFVLWSNCQSQSNVFNVLVYIKIILAVTNAHQKTVYKFWIQWNVNGFRD